MLEEKQVMKMRLSVEAKSSSKTGISSTSEGVLELN